MCFHDETKAGKWRRTQPQKLMAMVKLTRKGKLFAAWPTPDATHFGRTAQVISALRHWHPEKDLVLDLSEVANVQKKADMVGWGVPQTEVEYRKWVTSGTSVEEDEFLKGLLKIKDDPFEYIMLNAPNAVWRRAAWHLHNVEHERLGSHRGALEHVHA
jgi:hypothetical protein